VPAQKRPDSARTAPIWNLRFPVDLNDRLRSEDAGRQIDAGRKIGRETMRALLLGLIVAAGLGLACQPLAAAMPAGGMAIDRAGDAGLSAESVHCRRYPHRHMKARPHGLGFGCPKKVRPAR
jgi:hypothetical protein